MAKTYCVYRHTSPSGKSYIGQTCNYERRNRDHQRHRQSKTPLFREAIKKYGWDSFAHEILADGLTLDEANDVEVAMIRIYNTLAPNGYNVALGGDNRELSPDVIEKMAAANRGKKRDAETRQRMSQAMRGLKRSPEGCENIRRARMETSPETRKRMSESAKQRPPHSEETRRKMSQSHVGKKHNITEQGRLKISSTHKGKVVSEETRKKMSESRSGKPAHNKGKPMSESQKQKLRGRVVSDDTKKAISEASIKAWEEKRKSGTHLKSEETKQKMREAWAKRKAAKAALIAE